MKSISTADDPLNAVNHQEALYGQTMALMAEDRELQLLVLAIKFEVEAESRNVLTF